jgi:hypothetical protein
MSKGYSVMRWLVSILRQIKLRRRQRAFADLIELIGDER